MFSPSSLTVTTEMSTLCLKYNHLMSICRQRFLWKQDSVHTCTHTNTHTHSIAWLNKNQNSCICWHTVWQSVKAKKQKKSSKVWELFTLDTTFESWSSESLEHLSYAWTFEEEAWFKHTPGRFLAPTWQLAVTIWKIRAIGVFLCNSFNLTNYRSEHNH